MPGKNYYPLESEGKNSQLDRFRAAAKQGDVLDELIGLTLADTGIRNSAMAHMRRSWVRLDIDNPVINIPVGETCTLGVGNRGSGGDTTTELRGEPCYSCRNRPEKDWAPDTYWHPKTENAQRAIPLRNEDTIEVLGSYFRLYDTVAGEGTITRRVKKIGERAGLNRSVSPHDLRDTFGTKIAILGFTPYEIRDLMGHATLNQGLDYIKLSGANVQTAFDKKWK